RDLATKVEMEQLEAVEHVSAFEFFNRVQNFADCEAELAAPAARRLPAAAAARGQLDSHADLRPDANFLGVFENQCELGVFLDDRNDLAAHFLGKHGRL